MRAKRIYLDKKTLRDLQSSHAIQGMDYYFDLTSESDTNLAVSPLMLFSLIDFLEEKNIHTQDVQSIIWNGFYNEANSDIISIRPENCRKDAPCHKIFSAAFGRTCNGTAFSLYLLGASDQLKRPTILQGEYRNHPIFSDLFLAWILIGNDDEKKKEFTVRYFKKIKELASNNKEAMQELRESGLTSYATPMGDLGISYQYIGQELDSKENISRDMRKLLDGKRKEKTTEVVSICGSYTREVDKITYKDFGNKISPYTLKEFVEVFQEHITKAIATDRNKTQANQRRFDDNKQYLIGLSMVRVLGSLACDLLIGRSWQIAGLNLALTGTGTATVYGICRKENMQYVDPTSSNNLMVMLGIQSALCATRLCRNASSSKLTIAIGSLLLAANLYVSYDQYRMVYEDYIGRS